MIVCSYCNSINNGHRVTCANCNTPLDDIVTNEQNVRQSPLRVVGSKQAPFSARSPVTEPNIGRRKTQADASYTQPQAATQTYTQNTAAKEATTPSVGEIDIYSKRRGIVIGSVITVTLILLAAFAWYISNQNAEQANKDLFAKAEDLFSLEKYSEALALYKEYLQNSPNGDFVQIATQKSFEIRNSLLAIEEAREAEYKRLPGLLEKATIAYKAKRYLAPQDDYALMYIRDILKIDPQNSYINNMKQKIVNHYLNIAKTAHKKRSYRTATKHYENVLKVDALNIDAIEGLGKIKAR